MADIMTSIGLDINDFKGAVNQLQESTQKLKTGVEGNMLAMAAGVLGAASVFYTFSKKAGEDFDSLIKSSDDLSASFVKLSESAGFKEYSDALEKSVEKTNELNIELAKTKGLGGQIASSFIKSFNVLTGGKSLAEEQVDLQKQLSAQESERIKFMQRITALSDRELEISNLRLQGADEEIEKFKIKEKLERQRAAIIKSFFDANTKATLILNAEQIAANDEEMLAQKKIAQQDEHNRKQKDDFLKFQADEQKKIEDKAKQDAADALAANREMQAAEQALIDKENEKLSLKTQAQLQSKKVSDAEFNLSKAAKGTAEFYERQAELARERLKLENLLSARAKAYEKGQLSGRRFDREQEKARKKEEQGRARLDRQIARENKQPVPQRPAGVGGPIAPRPMMQPQAAQPAAAGVNGKAAGNVMTVETLNVKVLKSQ